MALWARAWRGISRGDAAPPLSDTHGTVSAVKVRPAAGTAAIYLKLKRRSSKMTRFISSVLLLSCLLSSCGGGGDATGTSPFAHSRGGSSSGGLTSQEVQTLSVTVVGDGAVTSVPTGVSCTSACRTTFNRGTAVVLTATPASGSKFVGWSDACTGTTCALSMDTDRSVTALFALQ